MNEIRVTIIKQNDRPHYIARWRDPITGKRRHETTGETSERAALRYASKLEQRLADGNHTPAHGSTWAGFRARLEAEHLPSLAESTRRKYNYVLDGFAAVIEVKSMAAIQAAQVTRYQSHMRRLGRSEQTIKGNLAYIRAALKWAKSQDMIKEIPAINLPKRAKGARVMKGRPITGEEFERMLKAVPAVAGQDAAASIEYLLRGLWWGGLRLGEALKLTWHYGPFCLVKFENHYYFRIEQEAEKGNTDRFMAVAPEFEMMLPADPPERGLVFRPRFLGMKVIPPRLDSMSKLIKSIGEQAQIITDVKTVQDKKGRQVEKKIYATAHDLRRAFGTRWAPRVNSRILMEMMRHASIQTTEKYYLVGNARDTCATLWATMGPGSPGEPGNKTGNKGPEEQTAADAQNTLAPEKQG